MDECNFRIHKSVPVAMKIGKYNFPEEVRDI